MAGDAERSVFALKTDIDALNKSVSDLNSILGNIDRSAASSVKGLIADFQSLNSTIQQVVGNLRNLNSVAASTKMPQMGGGGGVGYGFGGGGGGGGGGEVFQPPFKARAPDYWGQGPAPLIPEGYIGKAIEGISGGEGGGKGGGTSRAILKGLESLGAFIVGGIGAAMRSGVAQAERHEDITKYLTGVGPAGSASAPQTGKLQEMRKALLVETIKKREPIKDFTLQTAGLGTHPAWSGKGLSPVYSPSQYGYMPEEAGEQRFKAQRQLGNLAAVGSPDLTMESGDPKDLTRLLGIYGSGARSRGAVGTGQYAVRTPERLGLMFSHLGMSITPEEVVDMMSAFRAGGRKGEHFGLGAEFMRSVYMGAQSGVHDSALTHEWLDAGKKAIALSYQAAGHPRGMSAMLSHSDLVATNTGRDPKYVIQEQFSEYQKLSSPSGGEQQMQLLQAVGFQNPIIDRLNRARAEMGLPPIKPKSYMEALKYIQELDPDDRREALVAYMQARHGNSQSDTAYLDYTATWGGNMFEWHGGKKKIGTFLSADTVRAGRRAPKTEKEAREAILKGELSVHAPGVTKFKDAIAGGWEGLDKAAKEHTAMTQPLRKSYGELQEEFTNLTILFRKLGVALQWLKKVPVAALGGKIGEGATGAAGVDAGLLVSFKSVMTGGKGEQSLRVALSTHDINELATKIGTAIARNI